MEEDTRVEQPSIFGNSDPVCETPILSSQDPMVTGPEPSVSQDTAQVRQQDSPQTSPGVRRSTRIRRPNVKYSTEDFELSSIRGQLRGRKNGHP